MDKLDPTRGQGPWSAGAPRTSYSAIRLSSGKLLPIEVRLGRRVLRYIPADSAEGRRLLSEERVDIVDAGGRRSEGS